MAKAIRGVAAYCERADFIFRAPTHLVQEKDFYSENDFPPSHKNSNNPLAVEPETENDIARESFFAGSFMISLG